MFVFYIYAASPNAQPTLLVAQNESDTRAILRTVANAVLKDATFQFVDEKTGERFKIPQQASPDAQLRPESPYTDWRYWNGVLNIAMIRSGEVLAEPAYTKFSITNIAFNFDNYSYFEIKHKDQDKWNYPYGQCFIMEELDDYGAMGASLIEVQRRDPQVRYRAYLDKAGKFILTQQHRLLDSTFVRSFPQKWTLWADDLYMSISFLSRMGELTGDGRYFDDAAKQVINFHKHLFDEKRGLMHHCWYSDEQLPGVAFWGRANGWAMMAQVDLLDRIPNDHPLRDTLLVLLRRHILGIVRYQSDGGLWHQLLDKTDSYLETSCSAMFTYGIARAVNQGYIDQRYSPIAQRGWEGVLSKIRPDGQVEGVCAGTSVSDDMAYYYHRPTPVNDVHGIGVVLLAGAEILQMRK